MPGMLGSGSQAPRSIRLRPKTPVLRIERAERHWVIHLPQGERLHARYLIGADGVASKVRPWVYTYRRARRPPVYSAIRVYAAYPVMPGELELHYVPPYLPGYWWGLCYGGRAGEYRYWRAAPDRPKRLVSAGYSASPRRKSSESHSWARDPALSGGGAPHRSRLCAHWGCRPHSSTPSPAKASAMPS